jgi:iron complex outermembrane receptor protein
MKSNLLLGLFLLFAFASLAQVVDTSRRAMAQSGNISDTVARDTTFQTLFLQQVVVRAYEQDRKLAQVAAPVNIVTRSALNRFSNNSLLPAMNMNPGVRMEERSPGSYRLNIRGSSLRSLFGVRDIKIYLNEIPLTDPGGNTYLNQLSFYNVNSMEIIKGAAGSLYGAGIGGALLITSMPASAQRGVSAAYTTNSYTNNLSDPQLGVNLNLNWRTGDDNHPNSFSYAHQSSIGYRIQTAMRRDVASWETLLKATNRQSIHAYLFYSDLYYQTPGALTQAEFEKDPRQARPPVGAQPGAVQAKAAVYQKNFTAGFSHEYSFSDYFRNTTAVYGAYTDFSNPGIRVYEIRQEPHFGGRTVFHYQARKSSGGSSSPVLRIDGGVEAQKGFFETRDYANKGGTPDTLQTDDRINNWQFMVFAQADLKFGDSWSLTAGASFNKSSVAITRLSTPPPVTNTRTFENKIAPRIALWKHLFDEVSAYASASRGFSTPTVQELEKSNGLIGPPLQPEDGIDYEIGSRGSFLGGRLFIDINAFFFHLKNTIVQRIDSFGVAYSVNAGGTDQHGIETYISYQITDVFGGYSNRVKVWISHTWHDFHYKNFIQDTTDFSGKRLPSVPPQAVVAGLDIILRMGFYLNLTYTYADRIALNDANTAYAGSYNLFGGRLGYSGRMARKYDFQVFSGVDNAFNTRYSLGNDINAAGGRYYNAAPGVNYFAGLTFRFPY